MLAPVLHILPLTTIQRKRLLPVPGVLHARLNQRLSAGDVVAEARWAREHLLIDVARKLGVSPATADRLIVCKEGDELIANSLIAMTRGPFPRQVRAPRDGRVVVAGGGRVLLEVGEVNLVLRAGLPGQVIEVIPDRGVVIQTAGALIQGVWGNGRIESGVLFNLMDAPDTVLRPDRLDVSLRGMVILGGIVHDAETLNTAAELPVRGLILSSLNPPLLPLALQMRYPILVTDGFGHIPMNSAAYRLLSTNVKREASVNAESTDRFSGARPEVIIPLPVAIEPVPPADVIAFAEGQQVRLRAGTRYGAIGSIVRLYEEAVSLPSGLRAPAAEVRLETNEELLVPLANLEVVG